MPSTSYDRLSNGCFAWSECVMRCQWLWTDFGAATGSEHWLLGHCRRGEQSVASVDVIGRLCYGEIARLWHSNLLKNVYHIGPGVNVKSIKIDCCAISHGHEPALRCVPESAIASWSWLGIVLFQTNLQSWVSTLPFVGIGILTKW